MPIDIIQNIEKGVLPNTATTQLAVKLLKTSMNRLMTA